MEKQVDDYEQLSEKCATLEARIKEMHSERRYGGTMVCILLQLTSILPLHDRYLISFLSTPDGWSSNWTHFAPMDRR